MRWDAPNAPDNWSEVDDFIQKANGTYVHHNNNDFWRRVAFYMATAIISWLKRLVITGGILYALYYMLYFWIHSGLTY